MYTEVVSFDEEKYKTCVREKRKKHVLCQAVKRKLHIRNLLSQFCDLCTLEKHLFQNGSYSRKWNDTKRSVIKESVCNILAETMDKRTLLSR